MTTQNLACEVLVVGAGPTGLMAATLLQRSGVRVRIVDDRPHASRESRAFVVQARSLEIFAQLGLVDTLLGKGAINSGIQFHVGGKHTGGMNFDDVPSPDTPYRFVFMLPQSETEAVLIDEVTRQGLEIERGVKVVGLTQDADGVTAHATTSDGRAVEVRSAYVLGADGAHSVVRHALDLAFEGAPYAQTFLLADCRVQWPLDHNHFRVFLHREALGLFLPLKGAGLSRVMAADKHGPAHNGEAGGPAGVSPLELPELQDAIREASQLDVTLSDPVWITRYRVHHRHVNRYRVGRAFVAGDAAHIHSPAGGQGMNTGLQDAANLAWKLAAVLRRGADPALLDTYHDERLPVGEQVVATTDKLFSAAAGQTGWEATVRDWIAGPLTATVSHLGSVQQKAFRTVSEIDVAYAVNPFVAEPHAGAFGGHGPAPGHRAPNATVARHRDVFDLFTGYGFTVLAFSRQALEEEELTRLKTALDALCVGTDAIRAHILARVPFGRDERVEFVETATVFTTYGVTEANPRAIYVVRPDGYVAWRADGLDVEGCGRFLGRFGLAGSYPTADTTHSRPI